MCEARESNLHTTIRKLKHAIDCTNQAGSTLGPEMIELYNYGFWEVWGIDPGGGVKRSIHILC